MTSKPGGVDTPRQRSTAVGRSQENLHIRDYGLVVGVKKGVVIRIGEVSSSVENRTAGDDCWHTPLDRRYQQPAERIYQRINQTG